VIGSVDDLDGIAGPDCTRGNHFEVCARSAGRGKDLRPALFAHPAPKSRTGDARRRHLENDLVANSPTFADSGVIDIEANGGEILPEKPIRQFPAQPTLPFIEIFALECIDRLIIAAVMFAVADEISDEPTT
jgi:hypothetical protein